MECSSVERLTPFVVYEKLSVSAIFLPNDFATTEFDFMLSRDVLIDAFEITMKVTEMECLDKHSKSVRGLKPENVQGTNGIEGLFLVDLRKFPRD